MPIALDKEFDYLIPDGLGVSAGMRVLVDFNRRKRVGLVIGKKSGSKFKKLKTLIEALDKQPLLDAEKLRLGQALSRIYPYSPAEFLFMMLPAYLKDKRKTDSFPASAAEVSEVKPLREFVKAEAFVSRYRNYRELIIQSLKKGSVLICFPQLSFLEKARVLIEDDLDIKALVLDSRQSPKSLFKSWKESRGNALILGSRMSVLYYPPDLKLIVAEEANSPHYLYQEKPFHNLIDIAELICGLKNIDLILSSDYPALSTYQAIKQKKIALQEKSPDCQKIEVVRLGEPMGGKLINPVVREKLKLAACDNKKALILWNYKNSDKIISQLRGILPETSFTVATSKILSSLYGESFFDRGFVLDADFSLNRPDYDAAFQQFTYLKKLSHLVKEKLYVFTHNPGHYLFKGLSEDWRGFYEKELSFRKKLKLDPFGLSVRVALRAKNKNMLLRKANDLYNRLKKNFNETHGPFEEAPPEPGGKFKYYLVVTAKRTLKDRKLIKEAINKIRTSSIKAAATLS